MVRKIQVWTLPEGAAGGPQPEEDGFRLLLEPPVEAFTITDREDTVGSGVLTIPRDYEYKHLILESDPADLSNNRSSLIALFDTDYSDYDPCFEFFAEEAVENLHDSGRLLPITGAGIKSALDDGIIGPNVDGGDWVWGGKNLLHNPGFEESQARPDMQEVWSDATGGQIRIQHGSDTVDVDYNETPLAIELAIEAGITAINDIKVRGSGTEADPYQFEYVTPPFGELLSFTDVVLTGGDLFVKRTQFGALEPTGWEKSQTRSTGVEVIHGEYDSFRVTEVDPITGEMSLLIDPAAIGRRFAGAQQVPAVKPNTIAQAGITVEAEDSSQEYRFVIRGIDEDLIAETQATIPANTPTVFTLDDVDFGDRSQVIFRIANINVSGNPGIFRVDDAFLEPGFARTTIGEIVATLFADIQDRGTLTWLQPSWTATEDSNGDPWDADDLAFQAAVGQKFGTNVMSEVASLGYQWTIRRLETPTGTFSHEFALYNPGGLGATADTTIAVGALHGGSLAKRRIEKTHVLVEAATRETAWVTDARFAGIPRREGYLLAEQAEDLATAQRVGTQALDYDINNLLAAQVKLSDDKVRAYRDFNIGWTVPYSLGSRAAPHNRVVHSITVAFDGKVWTDEVTSSQLYADERARTWETFRRLLTEFRRRPRPAPTAAPLSGGKGGAPTVVVAAADSSDMSKAKADLICPGENDHEVINQALALLPIDGTGRRGKVILCEGNYFILPNQIHLDGDTTIGSPNVASGVHLQGLGYGSTRIWCPDSETVSVAISCGNFASVGDLTIRRQLTIPDT